MAHPSIYEILTIITISFLNILTYYLLLSLKTLHNASKKSVKFCLNYHIRYNFLFGNNNIL